VKQSVWRKHTTDPKTASAKKPVPVIEPLRELLAELREAEANPANGPILRGVKLSKDGKRAAIEPEFRRQSRLGTSSPKVWADSYLLAFATVAGLKLVTFERALRSRASEVLVL
jgi:hypothetical protein